MPAVRATRAALPHLLERAPATVVTVASVNSFLPDPGVIDYSAAKAALANLCKSLSKEFGPRGIRVNTVSPGPVETDLWLGDHGVAATVAGAGTDAASVVKQQAAAAPTGRFTRPEEVADVVALLAGAAAATSPAPTSSSTGGWSPRYEGNGPFRPLRGGPGGATGSVSGPAGGSAHLELGGRRGGERRRCADRAHHQVLPRRQLRGAVAGRAGARLHGGDDVGHRGEVDRAVADAVQAVRRAVLDLRQQQHEAPGRRVAAVVERQGHRAGRQRRGTPGRSLPFR